MNTQRVNRSGLRTATARVAAAVPLFLLLASCGGGSYGGGGGGGATLAPVITTAPVNTTVTAGQPVIFSVTAGGFMPLSYQWIRGGVDIAGAAQATYMLAAATAGDNQAMFAVRVSNIYGTVTSAGATLTVQ